MTDEEVKILVKRLDEDIQVESINKKMNLLVQVSPQQVELLINFNLKKSTWDKGVQIIEKIGYPNNRKAIPLLIKMLQDINWPGACRAIEILASISKHILLPFIEEYLQKAYQEEDYMWIGGLKRLVETAKIQKEDFSDEAIFELLRFSDF